MKTTLLHLFIVLIGLPLALTGCQPKKTISKEDSISEESPIPEETQKQEEPLIPKKSPNPFAQCTAFDNCTLKCPEGSNVAANMNPHYCTTPDNTMNGPYVEFYPNGIIMAQIIFKNGKEEGTLLRRHFNGQKYEEIIYVKGQKQGSTKRWSETGKLIGAAQFVDDRPCGTLTCFDKQGEPTQCVEMAAKCTLTPTGAECFPCQCPEDTELITTENEFFCQKDGKKDGPYLKLGDYKQNSSSGLFVEGKRQGTWRWWYEDGKQLKSQVEWKDDAPDGTAFGWYKLGTKKSESQWSAGKKHGK